MPAYVKNSTSYQLQAITKLEKIHEKFESESEGLLKFYQFFVRSFFLDPEFDLGGANGRGLLVYHSMGMGKTRLSSAVAMALWDTYEPLVLLPKSLQVNFENSVEAVVRILNRGHPNIDKLVLRQKKRFTFLSLNASNSGTKVATTKLRKRLIIVDEAHNLFRAIINGGKNAKDIYDSIMREPDLRIIFLTGTPCTKDPFEIVPCFNMLMGKTLLPTRYDHFNQFFINTKDAKITNAGVLANRLFGLISYAASTDKTLFPELLPRKVERCEMTPNQYSKYLLTRGKEKEEVGETASQMNPVLQPMTLPSSEQSFGTYYVKSRMLSNFCDGESPKFDKIISNLKESAGPAVVYSQFVGEGGLESLKTFLEKERITYSEVTGKVSHDIQKENIKRFNAMENVHGEKIKVLLISKSGAEGISLKRVRQIHIMEPYWDWSRHDQVEARAVRLKSHIDLPEDQRNVQTFIYLAVKNELIYSEMNPRIKRKHGDTTVDELFLQRALAKHRLNENMRELLKSVSLECRYLNLPTCRVCQPTDEPLYTDNINQDIKRLDPCRQIQELEVEVTKITLNGSDYYYRKTDSGIGYEFYTYNESIGNLVSIDHSDPIINELMDLVEPFQI